MAMAAARARRSDEADDGEAEEEEGEGGGEASEGEGVQRAGFGDGDHTTASSTAKTMTLKATAAVGFLPAFCIEEEDIMGGDPDELLKQVGLVFLLFGERGGGGGGLCALSHGVCVFNYYHLPVLCYVSYAEVLII